jgi:nucleotide-binding universal stress UspA family protein
MYKILILTDFSAASRHALSFAQALFADTATDFCLTNAFPFEPEMNYGGAFWLEEEQHETKKNLRHLQESIMQQPQPSYHNYRTTIILGEPVQAVDRLLTQERFDLIVLGTTGMGKNPLFGSVATGMIRQAKAHVLVVPTSAPIRPLEQLVLATDYQSVKNGESFTLMKEIASRKAATLTLLTIENPGEPATQPSETSRQYVLQALEGVKTIPYAIHDDDVLHGIDAYLDLHTVDVLVMVPHHKGFFDVLRNKSISRSVAYHPRVPLLALYDEKIDGYQPGSATETTTPLFSAL